MKKILLAILLFISVSANAQLTSFFIDDDNTLWYRNPSTGDSIQLTKLPKTIYNGMGTGTAYSLTSTSAAVTLGTSSPAVTMAKAGTYLVFINIRVDYIGATLAVNRTITYKVRRTTNTPADVYTALPITTPVLAIQTLGGPDISRQFIYTASAGDVLQVWAGISGLPSLGSVTIPEANIIALKLY